MKMVVKMSGWSRRLKWRTGLRTSKPRFCWYHETNASISVHEMAMWLIGRPYVGYPLCQGGERDVRNAYLHS